MSSIFSKIIAGDIPCAKLYEDERFFSFLDINPIHTGHALLVPKQEIDYIFDLPGDLLQAMLPVAEPIARAIEQHVSCRRVGLMVAGLEVPHCHLHLVPMDNVGDLNFANTQEANPQDLQELAGKIRKSLNGRTPST